MKKRSAILLMLTLICSTTFSQDLKGDTQINFGKIGKTTLRTLTLYNRGKTPIVITSSKVDCNCTKIEYSPRPIMAGDSTVIKITYVPNKDKGVFYKSATLKNSTNQDFKFIVRGTVI